MFEQRPNRTSEQCLGTIHDWTSHLLRQRQPSSFRAIARPLDGTNQANAARRTDESSRIGPVAMCYRPKQGSASERGARIWWGSGRLDPGEGRSLSRSSPGRYHGPFLRFLRDHSRGVAARGRRYTGSADYAQKRGRLEVHHTRIVRPTSREASAARKWDTRYLAVRSGRRGAASGPPQQPSVMLDADNAGRRWYPALSWR